jgi:prephenate dehydrogenase
MAGMSSSKIQFDRLTIVGVGLIGGSIARAAKARGIVRTVTGNGRNRARLESARECGVIDEIAIAPSEMSNSDLIIVCTPVDQIADDVCKLLDATRSPTLITDVGSVKSAILHKVQQQSSEAARFIGGHPLAGSHLTGFENADPQLYEDRTCVLTPAPRNKIEAVEALRRFWTSLGMRVINISADEHDRILALTSHLPHLAASALAGIIDEEFLDFA